MHRMTSFVCVAGFSAAVALFAYSMHEARAQCANPPGVPAFAAWRAIPTTDIADAMDHFDTSSAPGTEVDLLFSWVLEDTPFMGAAEWEEEESEFVSEVTHTPAYFFPSACSGNVGVQVEGTLDEGVDEGTVTTYGWVWDSGSPPVFEDDFHTLTVSDS